MNIAVIEDLEYDCGNLCDILRRNELCRKIGINIDTYSSGEALLAEYNPDKYQLVFIDMILDGKMNGMDTARALRNISKSLPIVFTTTEASYALESYEVQALDYLIKPCSIERVNSCIERVYSFGAVKVYITLQADRESIRFPAEDVVYALSQNHSVEVHLSDGRFYRSYITFDAFVNLLPKNSVFVSCYRGIIVNLQYADYIDSGDFVLADGKRLPISRSKKQQMQTLFNDYQINATRGNII